MWKSIVCTFLLFSASCFAANILEIMKDHKSDSKIENRTVIDVSEIESILKESESSSHSSSSSSSSHSSSSSSSHSVKIWFVDNSNPKHGNGSFKNPFNTLLAAQNASEEGDIIFVFPGDNTTTGMDQGFVMKDGQRLLGAGIDHDIDFPQKKLRIRAPSSALPKITNAMNENGVTLANSCEVSGFRILNINGGNAIIGSDNNPIPHKHGIRNTLIQNNLFTENTVTHGVIYLANCRGKLEIKDNVITNSHRFDTSTNSGIAVINEHAHVNSHIIIKKNVVSNNELTGITVLHNSPKGNVKASLEENQVFNIEIEGSGILIGTQGSLAGGKLCAEIKKNFCQNVPRTGINVQSSGAAHVKALVKLNTTINTPFTGIEVDSFNSSHLCLNLIENSCDKGYFLQQFDSSIFKVEPFSGNLGLPFVTIGTFIKVPKGTCHCK